MERVPRKATIDISQTYRLITLNQRIPMFIELTQNNQLLLVNINSISQVYRMERQTVVTVGGLHVSVDQSYEEVREIILDAQNNPPDNLRSK